MTLGGFSTPRPQRKWYATVSSVWSATHTSNAFQASARYERVEIDGSEITEGEIDHSENAEPAGRGRGKHQSDAQPLEGVVVPVRVLAINFFQVLEQVHLGAGPSHGLGWG